MGNSGPGAHGFIPAIVPRHSLVNAFALNSLAFSITRLAIPAVGGALIVFAGAGVSLLLQGAIVAVAAVMALGLGAFAPAAQSKLNPRSAFLEILEGVRYIRETQSYSDCCCWASFRLCLSRRSCTA